MSPLSRTWPVTRFAHSVFGFVFAAAVDRS